MCKPPGAAGYSRTFGIFSFCVLQIDKIKLFLGTHFFPHCQGEENCLCYDKIVDVQNKN